MVAGQRILLNNSNRALNHSALRFARLCKPLGLGGYYSPTTERYSMQYTFLPVMCAQICFRLLYPVFDSDCQEQACCTGMPAPAMRRRDAAVLAAEPAHQSLIAGMTALWWRWRLSGDATAEAALRALAHGQAAGGLGPVVTPDRFVLG